MQQDVEPLSKTSLRRKKPRLSPAKWFEAGLQALANEGPEAIRAEALARDLGTTKGSFYWHFKDLADFQARMLDFWREGALNVYAGGLVGQNLLAEDELYALIEIIADSTNFASGGSRVEPAIREWAESHTDAARAVKAIDLHRIGFIEEKLAAAGVPKPFFPRHAIAFYATVIGLQSMELHQIADVRSGLVDILELILGNRTSGGITSPI